MYSGLGFNFGHKGENFTDPGLTTQATRIINTGCTKFRLNIINYTDTSYRTTIQAQAVTLLGLGATKVILGLTVSGATFLTDTTMKGAYRTAALAWATWISGLSSDYQSKIELQIANEDDSRIDGTTVTAAQFRTYMTGTLASDVKAVATLSDISMAIRNDFISGYITNGKGNLDKIAENLYKDEATFATHVKNLVNAFGRQCYLSEFGYLDETTGYSFYNNDSEYAARVAWWQMDVCRSFGIPCYFFLFDTGLPSDYALLQSDNSLRSPFAAMTAKREQYTRI